MSSQVHHGFPTTLIHPLLFLRSPMRLWQTEETPAEGCDAIGNKCIVEQSHTQILSISEDEDERGSLPANAPLLWLLFLNCWTTHICLPVPHKISTDLMSTVFFCLWFLQFHVVPCLFPEYICVIPVITSTSSLCCVWLDSSCSLSDSSGLCGRAVL